MLFQVRERERCWVRSDLCVQTYAGEQNHYNIYIQYYNTCTSNCFTDGFKVSRPMFIFYLVIAAFFYLSIH